jgi:formylglycine-generating enzyme required for sulfatase activity
MNARYRDDAISAARNILTLDRRGAPCYKDTLEIYFTVTTLQRFAAPEVVDELVTCGFLAGAAERYSQYVAPDMREIPAVRYNMGTSPDEVKHFCGESPCHTVELSPFKASAHTVTNGLYAIFDPSRGEISKDARSLPVTDVTWFDAAVFALWMGCRLPTEAEWEYLCGVGGSAQWCCPSAYDLPTYAWYSDNADDQPHPVGTRLPNTLGMYDMHGNVWEWCADDYGDQYYAVAPLRDPLNQRRPADRIELSKTHKVSRGGGFYALSEMCRTRYRLHDPGYYWARDLGFRLTSGVPEEERMESC